MAKITKREALLTCRDLWIWMKAGEKKKSKDKENWPGWKNINWATKTQIEDGILEDGYYCPCCIYNDTHIGNYCSWTNPEGCLLGCIWPNGCEHRGTPYYSFYDDRGKPKDAQKIIDACEAELKKLK